MNSFLIYMFHGPDFRVRSEDMWKCVSLADGLSRDSGVPTISDEAKLYFGHSCPVYFWIGTEGEPHLRPLSASPLFFSIWKIGMWALLHSPDMEINGSKTPHLEHPTFFGSHSLVQWPLVCVCLCVLRRCFPPLPEASSTAGQEAASEAGAHCPRSTDWPGSCHLQRGGLPSGTFPSGLRSPAWGAVRSLPMSSSAPSSICLGKADTETWQSVDTDPRGLLGWSLLLLEWRVDVQFTRCLLTLGHSPREEEDGGKVRWLELLGQFSS